MHVANEQDLAFREIGRLTIALQQEDMRQQTMLEAFAKDVESSLKEHERLQNELQRGMEKYTNVLLIAHDKATAMLDEILGIEDAAHYYDPIWENLRTSLNAIITVLTDNLGKPEDKDN